MKKRLSLFLVVTFFCVAGFTRSVPRNAGAVTTAKMINAAYSLGAPAIFISRQAGQSASSTLEAQPTLDILPVENLTVDRYGELELSLRANLPFINPYDPDDVDLRVSFSAPSGKEVQVGAFWYQGFDPQTRKPSGEPGWKVRFTPDEVGVWMAVADAPALGLRSTPISFSVKPSDNPGFIQVNAKNQHYLAYQNGDFFFPIGVNMAWWDDGRDPITQYTHWLDRFSANGGNTIRVWMASWSFGIEWMDTGLGNYNNRQYEAWLLDQLFALATEHGVKIILVLLNHGAFSLDTNSEWQANPYNLSLGGPLANPELFVRDPEAITYFEQRLNYIINRWGYSPDLLAWEWFNEVNLTPITDAVLLPWLTSMTDYLEARDVNHHLTTTSFALRSQSAIWNLPGLDIIQTHEYSSQINESEHDLASRSAEDFQTLDGTIPEKPVLLGEYGYSARDYGDDIEKTGIHLHNGLWATTFSGYAGSGMYWWWDTYIDPNNLWYHFKGLARFLQGEDLAALKPFTPDIIDGPAGITEKAIGLGLRGAQVLVWLRSSSYTVQASVAARNGSADSRSYVPLALKDLSLVLRDMPDGGYTVSWFDPQQAQWLDTQTITAHHSTLILPIPAFRRDLAVKITPNP